MAGSYFRCEGTTKKMQRCKWRTNLFTDDNGRFWCIYHYDHIQPGDKSDSEKELCRVVLESPRHQRCPNQVARLGGEDNTAFVCTSHLKMIPRQCDGLTLRLTRCRRREGLMNNGKFRPGAGGKAFCSVADDDLLMMLALCIILMMSYCYAEVDICNSGDLMSELRIASGEGGLISTTLDNGDNFGASVAGLGDLDRNGVGDLAVGAPFDGPTDAGAVYLFLMNPDDGTVKGQQKISSAKDRLAHGDGFGTSVAGVGDVDRDGVPDLAVGAPGYGRSGTNLVDTLGAVYIMFLTKHGSVKKANNDGGKKPIVGPTTHQKGGGGVSFGTVVAGVGDLNKDGVVDLVVGGRGPLPLYMLYLKEDGSVKKQQQLMSSTQVVGVVMEGLLDKSYAFVASAVAAIGDVNGDGTVDLAVGAKHDDAGGKGRGAVYIFFMNLDGSIRGGGEISSNRGGLVGPLDNGDAFGSSVSRVGDMNGDGVVDLVVGAPLDDDGGFNRGAVYMLLLKADGSVQGEQKISSTQGGLVGPLGHYDQFGTSVTLVGDLDGDGMMSLAVGAPHPAFGDSVYVIEVPLGFVPVCAVSETCVSTGDGTTDNDVGFICDVDECEMGNAGCDQTCMNLVGSSYSCSCNSGWELNLDGHSCDEEEEEGRGGGGCSDENGGCEQNCHETADGSHLWCSCDFGWEINTADGKSCTVLVEDECDTDNGGCDQNCQHNEAGGPPTCSCNDGFIRNPDGYSCDVDMCYSGNVGGDLRIASGAGSGDESSVAVVGDVDGDEVVDLVVGGLGSVGVYVLMMNADDSVKSEHNIGSTELGGFGRSVAGVGDLNGDRVVDLAVGAHGDDDNRGAVYILFLNTDATVKAKQKISSTQGVLQGALNIDDLFGNAMGIVGDLDGDGVLDLAVGAPKTHSAGAADNTGAVYVLFLSEDGTEGVKGYKKISYPADSFGMSVAGLGDLDGEEDGVPDLVVGAHRGTDGGGINRGAVFIVFLNADVSVKGVQKITSTQGGLTGPLDDYDCFGCAVAGMGDLNGDGVVDLAVGAPSDDDGGDDRGAVYIFLMNRDGTVKREQKISSTHGGRVDPVGTIKHRFGSGLAVMGVLQDRDGGVALAVSASGAVNLIEVPAGFVPVCAAGETCVSTPTGNAPYECSV